MRGGGLLPCVEQVSTMFLSLPSAIISDASSCGLEGAAATRRHNELGHPLHSVS